MPSKVQFFNNFQFEWNSAKESDWPKIRRNFVAAYIASYSERTLEELQYGDAQYRQARNFFDMHAQSGYKLFMQQIIKPLIGYLNPLKHPLKKECALIEQYFDDLSQNENVIQACDYIVKLIMLQHYFEEDFEQEKQKILSKSKKIDFLIVRFEDHPVAFFVTEFNYKSANVYLRFVTVSPAFHDLGLGKAALAQISKHYPQSKGLELYTRKGNHAAKGFYEHEGFVASLFDFKERELLEHSANHFPSDDSTSHPESFVGYCKSIRPSIY